MLDRTLADLVLSLHFVFVAFVVLGGWLVLRMPRVAWVHLPAAAWGVLVEIAGLVCPLTAIENELRVRAGQAGYAGDFIDRVLVSTLYPEGLTRPIQVALGVLALLLNLVPYAIAIRRRAFPRA